MRKTRFMTWFFLTLSVSFFLLRDFRDALEVPLFTALFEPLEINPALERCFGLARYISNDELLQLPKQARQAGSTRLMAFAALYLPTPQAEEARALAEEVVKRKPEMAWVLFFVVQRNRGEPGWSSTGGPAETLINRLAALDPKNAAPAVMLADLIRQQRVDAWPKGYGKQPEYLNALAKEKLWVAAMEAAFAKPGFDLYRVPRFELEREVLLARGWAHPTVLLLGMGYSPIINLLHIRDYANLLVFKFGAEAEAAGRIQDALRLYRQPFAFGERMRLQSRSLIEDLIGMALQQLAGERLLPALEKAGLTEEAAQTRYILDQSKNDLLQVGGRHRFGRETNYAWSVFAVNFSATLVAVFAALTLLCVLYVNAKQWVRPERKGRLYELLTASENYVVILLFVSCLALHFSYLPFSQNLALYLSSDEPIYHLDLFWKNIYPVPNTNWLEPHPHPLENPFRDYGPYAVGSVALVSAVALLARLRRSKSATN